MQYVFSYSRPGSYYQRKQLGGSGYSGCYPRSGAQDLTPSAQVGDFVLVHAGFAIEVVSEEDAQETLDLIKQIPELADVEGL